MIGGRLFLVWRLQSRRLDGQPRGRKAVAVRHGGNVINVSWRDRRWYASLLKRLWCMTLRSCSESNCKRGNDAGLAAVVHPRYKVGRKRRSSEATRN